jgi:hypothetical protein
MWPKLKKRPQSTRHLQVPKLFSNWDIPPTERPLYFRLINGSFFPQAATTR